MLDIQDADHEESSPKAETLLISHLSCSLVGQSQCVHIQPDSLAYQAYQRHEVTEEFYCNYGLNPAFRKQIEDSRLKITGVDANNDVRIVELPNHPFFLATLFLPQASSQPNKPHPLILAYLRAALV